MENIRLAFQGIWGHKLRSILTMLGIIIGIAAIITIVSTIKGTNEQIKQNLIGSGNNVVTVQLYQSDYVYDMQYSSLPTGVRPIAEAQRAELEDLPGVDKVSFYLARTNLMDTVFFRDTAFSGKVYGIDRAYFQVAGYRLAQGRGFLDSDYENSRRWLSWIGRRCSPCLWMKIRWARPWRSETRPSLWLVWWRKPVSSPQPLII